jgi:hypothetical protein
MSSQIDSNQLVKTPRCVAITDIDKQKLAESTPTSTLDVLAFAANAHVITKECSEAPLSILSPHLYTAALTSELRTAAKIETLSIYCPSPIIAKTISHVLKTFVPSTQFNMIGSGEELQSAISEGRRFLLDCSFDPRSELRTRRHLAGSPVVQIPRQQLLVKTLSKIRENEILRNLGEPSAASPGTRLEFVQSTTLHTNGSCFIDTAVLNELATAYNSSSVTAGDDLTAPKLGFLNSYTPENFAEMLHKPGCRINLIRLGHTVLGYSVSYLDPTNQPLHSQRLAAALETNGRLPSGTWGYVDSLHTTDIGRGVCQLAGVAPYRVLLDQLVLDSKEAGITHLIAQTRELPHPNDDALAVHKYHGWREAGVSLLYPKEEGPDGWEYVLGKVIVLDLSRFH